MKLKNRSLLLLTALGALFCTLMSAQPAAASGAATFIRNDTKTQGTWQGVYGADGYVLPEPNASKSPAYVAVTPQGQSNWVWASTGTDVRDLQVPGSSARQASCWYSSASNSFDLDVNVNDGNSHQIALYALDWDSRGRAETVEAVDGDTGAELGEQSISNFANGIYLVWDASGHVKFIITQVSGDNAVLSGAFFDPETANATSGIAHFVTSDTTTKGNWLGAYGADGYSLAGSSQSVPAYAALTPQNQQNWTWAATTSDTRALELPSNTGRIAETWYNSSAFSIDVNITDGGTHQISLYSVDWDSKGRAQTIQVVDAQTKALLDTRSITGFTNGVYLVWTVSGHVTFTVTATSGPNAVVSGVFFGTAGTVPTAPVTTTSSTSSSSSSSTSTSSSSSSSSDANCPAVVNAVSFNGIDSVTQGAWKGIGNFNTPPASSSLIYGKDGDILPDTEGCDTSCNPFPAYASFGPACVSAATSGNTGSKPNSTHAYVNLVQGSSGVMGAEPGNTTNTNFFQCNYTNSNPAAPWAPMVAWRPTVDTREISNWYTCSGIVSFYLEFSFGNSTHNFEIYVVDDQNGGTAVRSEEIQVLDGNTNAVLYDSGSFTNFTDGVYYKWSVTGHVKVKVINTSTNGTNAVINGVFFN